MNNKILPVLLILLFGLTAVAFAQTPAVIVEYYENISGEMYVRTPDGAEYEVDQFGFGEELPVGATLITLDGDYAELRMDPNGTIIRVGENTNFRIDGLQGRGEAQKNTFSVAVGKFKAVVAKQDGALYSFRGSTAVMGVRGTTIIGLNIPGMEEVAYVLDGIVEYTNAAGQTLMLGAGQAANALAANFAAFQPSGELLQNLQRGMDFVRLRVNEVPGYIEELTEEVIEEAEEKEEEKTGEKAPPPPEEKIVSKTEEMPEEKPEAESPEWLEKMMNLLGVELGATTLYDEEQGKEVTWAKAIIQPKFAIGKLKVALYLPIIYKDDMFDPATWYKPEGNDEWSFGTDQDGWDAIALDAVNDLFLKIRYIQWGENRDPFFFKFGNIDNFQLGHGSIMRKYANDLNFPAERKIGLDLGVNREKGGLQLMVNNAADPEIFGLRGFTRPFAPSAKFGLGLSALADISPQRLPWEGYTGNQDLGDPIFLNLGLDVEQPIVEREALSLILFADLASMIPYFREDPVDIPVPGLAGFATDAIWYGGKPRNWGVDAGIFGKMLILDYRLEFLYSHGTYRPFFYGPLYDVESLLYVEDLVTYLADPSLPDWDTQRMGVYGELGYTLDKVFYINGGYEWNWPINPTSTSLWPEDMLWVQLGIFEDLLPLYGSVALTKKDFASAWINYDKGLVGKPTFLDTNLILSGELVYPVAPFMELAVIFQSNVFEGEWTPSVSILTRLN